MLSLFGPTTFVLVALLSIAGVQPVGAAQAPALARPVAAPRLLAAGKLWTPKKSRPRGNKADADARIAREEEELLRPRNASDGSGARPQRRMKMEAQASPSRRQGDDDEAEEDDDSDDDDEDHPTVSKRRRSSDDDDDDDDDEGVASLPPIAPRVIAFGVGSSFLHRSFSFDKPLQRDIGFRLGYALTLESFPMLLTGPGWHQGIGLGFQYANELVGSAGVRDSNSDALVSYPVKQARWGLDLRYALTFGEHVVVIPALGYGKVAVDLQRPTAIAPSACTAGSALPCFPDVNASHLTADLHLRIAVSSSLGFSLVTGLYRGLSVSREMGGIAAEAPASSNGFHVEPGMTMMLGDWFAVQAQVPIIRNSYSFGLPSSGVAIYRSATETYYGFVVGVALLL
jgi:hypothetical protein